MNADSTPASSLPRILVADDSRIVRATIRKHLSGVFDIIEAVDGEDAWSILKAHPNIQVLISDLGMPNLDGFGLLQRIRTTEDAQLRKLPVIVISGDEEEEVKRRAVGMGASDFITKSTDRTELIARVTANVQRAETEAALDESRAELDKKAAEDATTGLGTRNLLEHNTRQAIAHAARHHQRVILLLLQLDRYEETAARFGQAVSDQILKALAKLLASKVRGEDTIVRLGDSSFGVLSASHAAGEEMILAERLRTALEGARINFKGHILRYTASVGVLNTEPNIEAEEAFSIAEARMNAAIKAGGNRVLAQDVTPHPLIKPDLAGALALIREGKVQDVVPFAAELLGEMMPLLNIANQQLLLGLSMDKLREKAR
ncbi:diguanylate cyclase (GGDEF)-like protein [Chitinivorax tropicus]|uniref:Diguanylate cyclase (GGDEF)-like protein n=1 Tax=Chitinivorax tropicus TaxID=714531 RepID=A0A840MQA0_9PROT|nr:diguanylate cyclase [Chitinivorax tropicus]MBB5019247.1 diguanylate cyclase (GGDEF)-like protein [Chitinivorax tropicus]